MSSTAAPSVRAGKLFENQLSVAGGLVAICQSGDLRCGKKADVSRYKGVFCDKSLQIRKLPRNLAGSASKMLILKNNAQGRRVAPAMTVWFAGGK